MGNRWFSLLFQKKEAMEMSCSCQEDMLHIMTQKTGKPAESNLPFASSLIIIFTWVKTGSISNRIPNRSVQGIPSQEDSGLELKLLLTYNKFKVSTTNKKSLTFYVLPPFIKSQHAELFKNQKTCVQISLKSGKFFSTLN